jgi:hypothetical protein
MKPFIEEDPSIDGPEYVALVIEWDELAGTLESKLAGPAEEQRDLPEPQTPPIARRLSGRVSPVVAALGAFGTLGVILAAVWGIRRLRAA